MNVEVHARGLVDVARRVAGVCIDVLDRVLVEGVGVAAV